MDAIGATSQGDVHPTIDQQARAMAVADLPDPSGPRQQRPPVEILLAQLDGSDPAVEDFGDHALLTGSQRFSASGWSKPLPVGHQHHRREGIRTAQSSIPSIGLDAVA